MPLTWYPDPNNDPSALDPAARVGEPFAYADEATATAPREPVTPPRRWVLEEAQQAVTDDRNRTHGEPTRNLADIASLWTILLADKLADDAVLESYDVAKAMVAMKLARMRAQHTADHWIDVCGYGAIGYECDVDLGHLGRGGDV